MNTENQNTTADEVITEQPAQPIQNPQSEEIEQPDIPENPEVVKLRGKNRELLDESKQSKAKAKELQAALDHQNAELERLQSIEQELHNFKARILWNKFLDSLDIIEGYRDYISAVLLERGYKASLDTTSGRITDHEGKELEIGRYSGTGDIEAFKRQYGTMFYSSRASGGGAGFGSSVTIQDKPEDIRNRAAEMLRRADALELELERQKQGILTSHTASGREKMASLNFGIK